MKRILNEEPTEEFYENKFTKYDCVVQEGVLTDTQRQQFFRQLLDLKQLGEPIPPMLLAKAAPLQGKSEYLEEMEKLQEQQNQSAAKQEQIQNTLIQAQTDLATSRSVEQMAGAKERFTRSVANLGLEDERNAAAVENRADAAFKRAQTAKEIENLDIRNAKELLEIVESMNRMNQAKEQQLKQEDVQISSASDQLVAGNSPNLNQSMEVANAPSI